jgi:hypothetical protein
VCWLFQFLASPMTSSFCCTLGPASRARVSVSCCWVVSSLTEMFKWEARLCLRCFNNSIVLAHWKYLVMRLLKIRSHLAVLCQKFPGTHKLVSGLVLPFDGVETLLLARRPSIRCCFFFVEFSLQALSKCQCQGLT